MIFFLFSSLLGTKYDLDVKVPNKSGQNFKSGEDMIEMYKELCSGMLAYFIMFLIVFSALFLRP